MGPFIGGQSATHGAPTDTVILAIAVISALVVCGGTLASEALDAVTNTVRAEALGSIVGNIHVSASEQPRSRARKCPEAACQGMGCATQKTVLAQYIAILAQLRRGFGR